MSGNFTERREVFKRDDSVAVIARYTFTSSGPVAHPRPHALWVDGVPLARLSGDEADALAALMGESRCGDGDQ